MAAYLCASDILVNSLVGKAAQSIVTKIGDYLAAGKPLINAAVGAEFRRKVEEDGFGVNVQPGDASALSAALLCLIEDAAAREGMGEQARHIAEQQFARRVAYQSTVDLIDQLVECWRAG